MFTLHFATFHTVRIFFVTFIHCSLLCRELCVPILTHCRGTYTVNMLNQLGVHVCSHLRTYICEHVKCVYIGTVDTFFSLNVIGFVYIYMYMPTHECLCGVSWPCCVALGVSVCTTLVHTRSIKGVPLLLHGVHRHTYVHVYERNTLTVSYICSYATACAGPYYVIGLLSTNIHTTCLHTYM